MLDYKVDGSEWFEQNNLSPPESFQHGLDSDIRANMKPLVTKNWILRGTELSCETDQGPLVQTIPAGYLCLGTDDKGLPILRKI